MKRLARKIIWILVILFLLMNAEAAYQAYAFTHFSKAGARKTHNPEKLGFFDKIWVIIKGIENPRPEDGHVGLPHFEERRLQGHDGMFSCLCVPKPHAKGTVILFHGYACSRTSLEGPATIFDSLGYQTVLVDFEGSGASDGNRTTVGYYEADDVAATYNYCKSKDSNIILFGSSMGASAIIRAISARHIHPAAYILECPYGSMMDAAKNRFRLMGIPSFPMANLLVFWGGIENGYWAFDQDCVHYAKDIRCPVLLMRGLNDKYVSIDEDENIFKNLQGLKKFIQFPNTGHEAYWQKNHEAWVKAVEGLANSK